MCKARRHIACHRKRTCLFRRAALRRPASQVAHPDRLLRTRRQGHADSAEHLAEVRMSMVPSDSITAAITAAVRGGRPALVGYLTAGFPDRKSFKDNLAAVAELCDVVEIGVPFSDPMADGT